MNAFNLILSLIIPMDDTYDKPQPHPDKNPAFDDYWDMIVYNANLTNTNNIVVEAIRQWLILIVSIVLTFLFLASIRVLHKAQK